MFQRRIFIKTGGVLRDIELGIALLPSPVPVGSCVFVEHVLVAF